MYSLALEDSNLYSVWKFHTLFRRDLSSDVIPSFIKHSISRLLIYRFVRILENYYRVFAMSFQFYELRSSKSVATGSCVSFRPYQRQTCHQKFQGIVCIVVPHGLLDTFVKHRTSVGNTINLHSSSSIPKIKTKQQFRGTSCDNVRNEFISWSKSQ